MEAEKDRILGKLYALRAGMSYIAAEKSELKEAIDCYNAYENVANTGAAIKELKNRDYDIEEDDFDLRGSSAMSEKALNRLNKLLKIKRNLEEGKRIIKDIDNSIENKLSKKESYSNQIQKAKKKKITAQVLIGVAVVLIVCGIISIIATVQMLGWNGAYLGLTMELGLPVGIILIIVDIFLLADSLPDLKCGKKDFIENNYELENLKRKRTSCTNDIKRWTREMEQYKKEQPALYEEYKQVKAKVIANTYPVYVILTGEERIPVSENDWKNLDLIIYYFETGRADSIKEALILVDRQKQTDAIVMAVENAGYQISRTIATATAALMQTIKVACTEICDNIKAVGERLDAINAGIRFVGSSLDALVDATELQNALISQANRTSREIAADVSYMRNEYDFAKRNGKI